jgi:hypothetical protein
MLITQRADDRPLYVYGDTGEAIRSEKRAQLDEGAFNQLSQWLDPDPDDSLFGAPVQIWRARKPPL